MKRAWNVPLFASELADDQEAERALAAVAEPRFIEATQRGLAEATANGQKVCIATYRGKYDADGQEVTGEEEAVGEFHTDAYEFKTAESSERVERRPELEGTGAAQMLALEIALDLSPDVLRAILNVKVILDTLGGQVWIAPHVREGEVIGYAFVWDHVSKLMRGKEPDANIAEPQTLVVKDG